MRCLRALSLFVLLAGLLSLVETPSAGQGNPKTKPKPGAPLVGDPADLPRVGKQVITGVLWNRLHEAHRDHGTGRNQDEQPGARFVSQDAISS